MDLNTCCCAVPSCSVAPPRFTSSLLCFLQVSSQVTVIIVQFKIRDMIQISGQDCIRARFLGQQRALLSFKLTTCSQWLLTLVKVKSRQLIIAVSCSGTKTCASAHWWTLESTSVTMSKTWQNCVNMISVSTRPTTLGCALLGRPCGTEQRSTGAALSSGGGTLLRAVEALPRHFQGTLWTPLAAGSASW